MKIIRAQSPDVIEHMEPHLVFTDDRLKGPFITELVYRMTKVPETVQVLVSFDDETKEIRAQTISLNPGPLLPFILLPQVWSHPENPWSWWQQFLSRIIIWAIANDKDYIRAETNRNTTAMMRRFGFEPYLQLIKFDLVKSGYKDMLADHPEEILYPSVKEHLNG